MAGISGNFNFPSDKGFSTRSKVSQAGEKAAEVVGDSVHLVGTGMASPMVAGLVASMASANPELKPAEIKELLKSTSDHGVINPQAAMQAAVNRSPMTLSMDEAYGISAVGDSQRAAKGDGLTGLNSIASVVSSGRFEGLNASYGEKRLFSL